MTVSLKRQAGGFRFAETFYGDTMQAIALRELGDASRWVDIAALNKLRPPYLSDILAADGVLLTGSLIRIPSATQAKVTTTDPDLVFEVDVKLSDDGQVVMGPTGDFDTVSGLANFKQALRNLLNTDTGELMFHPSYGTKRRQIIGTVNGPTAALLGSAYAKTALASDSRVQQVISSVAKVQGDKISITAVVQPIVGRAVDISQVI